ncbi:MAG: hypothetical protein IPO53_10715 [Chitinophagaceae bacterium]|nr:hypothetical protein [Chitinophagaceae bacterium]
MKYKPAILFIFFCLSGAIAFAQPEKIQQDSAHIASEISARNIRLEIDSLLKLTEISNPDSLKVNRLNLLAMLFSNFSYDTAMVYASEAKEAENKKYITQEEYLQHLKTLER